MRRVESFSGLQRPVCNVSRLPIRHILAQNPFSLRPPRANLPVHEPTVSVFSQFGQSKFVVILEPRQGLVVGTLQVLWSLPVPLLCAGLSLDCCSRADLCADLLRGMGVCQASRIAVAPGFVQWRRASCFVLS